MNSKLIPVLFLAALFAVSSTAHKAHAQLLPMIQFDHWGFINTEGNWVIDPQFERAQRFSEGLAGVMQNGMWGFIDESGEFVVEPRFFRWMDSPAVKPFSEGLAVVYADNDEPVVINRDGETVLKGDWNNLQSFRNGRARARLDSRYGFIDAAGAWVIEPEFNNAGDFSDGLAPVQDGESGQWGYIDTEGAWVIGPQYYEARTFHEGLAAVSPAFTEWMYIDRDGEMAIDLNLSRAGPFGSGRALVGRSFDRWYITSDGSPAFDDALMEQICFPADFEDGFALVGLHVEGRRCSYASINDQVEFQDGIFAYLSAGGEVIYRQTAEEIAAMDARRDAAELEERAAREAEEMREAERLAACPDFAEYGNADAPNHLRVFYSGKERVLYFDDVWVRQIGEGAYVITLPPFGQRGQAFGLNGMSFRLRSAGGGTGTYDIRAGLIGSRTIDCIEFPERTIDDFFAEREAHVTTIELPDGDAPGEFAATFTTIANPETGDRLEGSFRTATFAIEPEGQLPVRGTRVVDGEREAFDRATVRFRTNQKTLIIEHQEEARRSAFQHTLPGFDGEPGRIERQQGRFHTIIDVERFSKDGIALREYRIPLEEQEEESLSFFTFGEASGTAETHEPSEEHVVFAVESDVVLIDPYLPSLVYDPIDRKEEARPQRPEPRELTAADFPESVNQNLPAIEPFKQIFYHTLWELNFTETAVRDDDGGLHMAITSSEPERAVHQATLSEEQCMEIAMTAEGLEIDPDTDLQKFYDTIHGMMARGGLELPEADDPDEGLDRLHNAMIEECEPYFMAQFPTAVPYFEFRLELDPERGRPLNRTTLFNETHVSIEYGKSEITLTAENESQGRHSATLPAPDGIADVKQLHALLSRLPLEPGFETTLALFDVNQSTRFSFSLDERGSRQSTREIIDPVFLQAHVSVRGAEEIILHGSEREALLVRVAFDGRPVGLWSIGDQGNLIEDEGEELPYANFYFDEDTRELLQVRGAGGVTVRALSNEQ